MFGELMTENRLNSVTFILNTARKILLKDDKVSSSEIAFSVVFSSKITNKTLYMLAYSKTQLGQNGHSASSLSINVVMETYINRSIVS